MNLNSGDVVELFDRCTYPFSHSWREVSFTVTDGKHEPSRDTHLFCKSRYIDGGTCKDCSELGDGHWLICWAKGFDVISPDFVLQ